MRIKRSNYVTAALTKDWLDGAMMAVANKQMSQEQLAQWLRDAVKTL
jgi:hypothetical protein